MKNRPLAWAAAGVTLAGLARRFSPPALPDPGPLPASVLVPDARPPGDMELIAVPTGVNNRVAAYAFRGGSVFDRRDFYIYRPAELRSSVHRNAVQPAGFRLRRRTVPRLRPQL